MYRMKHPGFMLLVLVLAFLTATLTIAGGYLDDWEGQPPSGAEKLAALLPGLDETNGVSGLDLRALDLAAVPLDVLANTCYDTRTLWPEATALPDGFTPQSWLEDAKSGGAALDALHRAGITGEGVSIAIIDKPMLAGHDEFAGSMTYRETDMPGDFRRLHFHGISCASLIAGRSCGVAPGASLYYFAVPDNGQNAANYCRAMDELIAFNRTLPDGKKIRLASISDAIGEDAWERWRKVLEQANREGIAVNYSNGLDAQWQIAYGGCPPNGDSGNADDYVPEMLAKGARIPKSITLIPSGYRTTAANEGDTVYRFWPTGGFSWAIAYMSGLCALAWQIDPDIAYDDIIDRLCETKAYNRYGYGFIDPEAFFNSIEK